MDSGFRRNDGEDGSDGGGDSSALNPKASRPASSSPTMRSAQPAAVRTYWRIGSASKNSLAMTMAGPGGSAAMSACQVTRRRRRASPPGWRGAAGWSRRGGRAPRRGRPAGRARRAADRPSACRGRDQARRGRTGDGAPIASQVATAQRPISSPKIWLTSGAVTKSPARPKGSRRHVVAVLGIAEAERHVVGDGDRPVGRDRAAILSPSGVTPAGVSAGFRRDTQTIRTTPATIIGIDSSHAHGEAAGEVADLDVGLAEELDEGARRRRSRRRRRRRRSRAGGACRGGW